MRRLSVFVLFIAATTLCIAAQVLAQAAAPKPEEVLRKMCDYLGGLPAFSCRMVATHVDKAEGDDPDPEVTKMTARLERPNKLALIVDEGKMGLTIVSDGKQLIQYLAPLKRFTVSEAPTSYAPMTDIGVPLKPMVLGSQGSLIPTGGEDNFKRLVAHVESSKYIGTEKVGSVMCHHLRFVEKQFDWDVWIHDGKEPLIEKVVVDFSKQFAGERQKITFTYTVTFSDWNVAPKFQAADFAFKPPAGAEEVDQLIEPDQPHPLLGKPAPLFKTVELNGHPFDLKSHLGKDVILLDFWQTTCGPCAMLMPELEEVAKKFADRGFVYRAVNGGEDAEMIQGFLAATKIKAPIIMDPEGEISRAYMVDGIPQTVLIGKDGKVHIINRGYGPQLADKIAADIEALLAGKDLAGAELAKYKKPSKKRPAAANPNGEATK